MDNWEDSYCKEQAVKLKAAIDALDWDAMFAVMDEFCHEGFGYTVDGIGICSYALEENPAGMYCEGCGLHAVPPACKLCGGQIIWLTDKRFDLPLKEWAPGDQETALKVANHVLSRLENGQTGC